MLGLIVELGCKEPLQSGCGEASNFTEASVGMVEVTTSPTMIDRLSSWGHVVSSSVRGFLYRIMRGSDLTFAAEQNLQPRPLDLSWRKYADRLAAEWRATGLEIDLVEYFSATEEPGTYVLTAHTTTTAMICTCQSWTESASARPVWSVSVSLRRLDLVADVAAPPGSAYRVVGSAIAAEHEAVWKIILDWIDGKAALHTRPIKVEATDKAAQLDVKTRLQRYYDVIFPSRMNYGAIFFTRSGLAILISCTIYFAVSYVDNILPKQADGWSDKLVVANTVVPPDPSSGSLSNSTITASRAGEELSEGMPKLPTALPQLEVKAPSLTSVKNHASNAEFPPGSRTGILPMSDEPQVLDLPKAGAGTMVSGSALSKSSDTGTAILEQDRREALTSPVQAAPITSDLLPAGQSGDVKTAAQSKPAYPVPLARPQELVGLLTTKPTAPTSGSSEIASTRNGSSAEPRAMVSAKTVPADKLPATSGGIGTSTTALPRSFAIQVAAVSNSTAVPDVWRQLTTQFPSLGGLRPHAAAPIRTDDDQLLYRVAGGMFQTRVGAQSVCNRIRSQGGDCMVLQF